MRLLQLHVDDGRHEEVRELCDSMDLECFLVEEAGGGSLAYVPVPTGAVDGVLKELREGGLEEEAYVGLVNMEGAIGVEVEEISGRFAKGPAGGRGITHRQLRAKIRDLRPGRISYTAFAALAGGVATSGLLLNSAIVIVGAMVIAPFAGSLLAASVGLVVDDDEMVVESIVTQVLGLAAAYASALVVALLARSTGSVPAAVAVTRIDQIHLFQTPTGLAIVIAVCAGTAGALALAEDLSTTVAGIAVAAAIVPAASASAIGAVWSSPQIALGGLVLLFVNVVCINLTAYLGFYTLGYRTALLDSVRDDLSISIRSGAYTAVSVVFAVVVVVTVVTTAQHLVFESAANTEIEATLEDPSYDELSLVSISTEYNTGRLFGTDQIVSVTVATPGETDHPDLAVEIREGIEAETGDEVVVEVRFVEYTRAESDGGDSEALSIGATRRIPAKAPISTPVSG